MLLHTVIQTIRRHNLLERGQHILVGVSGGADSVALLAVLRELAPMWKFRLTVAHLNHGIRGPAAAADAAFVADLARRWKLDFIGGRVNVPLQARRRGISLEMAGRAARYEFFAKTAHAHHCVVVATAHTADDQAETILLNLARGAGAAGLAGIPYAGQHRGLKIVRPLRDATRENIERFLTSRHLTWREDATNADPAFLRNRVRHEILPFLEKRLNPGVRLALLRAGEILSGENEWLNHLADEILGQCHEAGAGHNLTNGKCNLGVEPVLHRLCLPEDSRHKVGSTSNNRGLFAPNLDAEQLAGFPVAARRRVLRRWLESCGVDAALLTFDAIERLDDLAVRRLTDRSGRVATLGRGWLARRQGSSLSICRAGTPLRMAAGHGTIRQQCQLSRADPDCPKILHGDRAPWLQSCSRPAPSGRSLSHALWLRDSFAPAFHAQIAVPGRTILPDQDCRISASIGPGIIKEQSKIIGALPARASLSLRAWRKRRLIARSWKPGDRMRPLGMRGTKKLQDIFSDGKVPPTMRHKLPVIECRGEIVWIPGFRIAQGWAVGPDESKALQLACIPL